MVFTARSKPQILNLIVLNIGPIVGSAAVAGGASFLVRKNTSPLGKGTIDHKPT